jgi:hypothetical protein
VTGCKPEEADPIASSLRLSGVAVACCLFTIFAIAVKPVTDPDFWWHLATGRYMVGTHVIPHHDVFSLTALNHVWITHEWVTELLFYGGWSLGGTTLLILATACVITITFAIVHLTARERGAPALLSAAIVTLAAISCAHTWGTRPQMLSLLLTALFGLGITRMLTRRLAAPPLWMPLAMVLWVNLHGGFIFGLALISIATAAYLVSERYALRPRSQASIDGHGSRANLRQCSVVIALTAAATLINPNGLSGALYPLSYLGNNASTRYIAEWVSPDFHQTQYLLFEALVLALLVGALASPRRARFADIVVLLPFLYLAFESVRNISLFAVLGAPIAAEMITSALPERWQGARAPRPTVRGKVILNWLAVIAIGAGIVVTTTDKLTATAQAKAVAKMYPVEALQYFATHHVSGRGFDSYNWGGYLIWNWYPSRHVYVDGRPDMYGDVFMDRYVRAYRGESLWRSLFSTNELCYALVEPSSGIAGVLRREPGWIQVYHDKVSALFVMVDQRLQCR